MFFITGKVIRMALFLVCLIATLAWLVAGLPLTDAVVDNRPPSATTELNEITEELMREDPEAAATITRLRENREVRELALASAVHESKTRGGLPAVRSLLKESTPLQPLPGEIRLAMLATDPQKLPSAAYRDRFLSAHGTAVQVLQTSGNPAHTQAYLDQLELLAHSDDRWQSVYDDSFSLVVAEVVDDPSLWDYYLQEKEEGWIEEALTQAVVMAEGDPNPDSQEEIIADFLQVAQEYHPYFKQALMEHGFDGNLFFLFNQYGNVIEIAITKHALPIDEVLEVIFANTDYFEEKQAEQSETELAATLAYLRNHKPSVWQEARYSALTLRLHDEVPQYAEEIFIQYPQEDLAAFLYAGYEDEIVNAATAVAKFGDLAVYILTQYQDAPEFHEALGREEIGPRLIPYVARFNDRGLDRLEENKAWLDKYFTKDGTPKEEEWWTQIPGGAAAKVAKNWSQGHPSEWSEIGWATLDVADAALLVASFGSSGAVTTSVKQGAKTAVQKVAKSQVKQQVIRAGRTNAAKAVQGSSRLAARQTQKTLLRKVAERGIRMTTAIKDPISKTWRFALATGRLARTAVERVYLAARNLNRAWKSVPRARRVIVYRSLLAVGLFITLTQRTIPALAEIGEAAGKFVRELIDETKTSLAEGLNRAIDELLGYKVSDLQLILPWVVYFGVLLLLAWFTWITRPRLGRLKYA
ncbi:Hypothetical protein PBC10988_26720 [Planctomycetales bacterium 10988]|nr:Hypothetical protein PBC10988_26720 [Planctomycetales bacterium 10988]